MRQTLLETDGARVPTTADTCATRQRRQTAAHWPPAASLRYAASWVSASARETSALTSGEPKKDQGCAQGVQE